MDNAIAVIVALLTGSVFDIMSFEWCEIDRRPNAISMKCCYITDCPRRERLVLLGKFTEEEIKQGGLTSNDASECCGRDLQ